MTRNNYDVIKIFTMEGETWALFTDLNMNKCPNFRIDKKLNYEFVKVMSNHVHAIFDYVTYLDKGNDFTCLFHRA